MSRPLNEYSSGSGDDADTNNATVHSPIMGRATAVPTRAPTLSPLTPTTAPPIPSTSPLVSSSSSTGGGAAVVNGGVPVADGKEAAVGAAAGPSNGYHRQTDASSRSRIAAAAGGGLLPPLAPASNMSNINTAVAGVPIAAHPQSHYQSHRDTVAVAVGIAGGDGGEVLAVRQLSAVDDLSREFYRKETIRSTVVMVLIGIISFFTVPIVGLMLVPVGVGVLYWLKDSTRFASGGDISKCFNRNSCVNFYIILLAVTIGINLVDVLFLIMASMESSSATASSATGGSGSDYSSSIRRRNAGFLPASRLKDSAVTAASPSYSSSTSSSGGGDAQYHATHGRMLVLEVLVNSVSAVAASYTLYVTKKLQGLLD